MTSKQDKKSESGQKAKKSVKPIRMALLPPNPTDEELQQFVDFLNGERAEPPTRKPAQPSPF